ncbi:hypothetical protein Mapa_016662 [Marchantia paleacea]|nr:hypothetical protein Mapa_016662 [Marchantia paleacea]
MSRHGLKRDRDDSPPSSRSSRARISTSEEPEDTKVTVRQVAEHYSNRSNQTREEREASPIIHLKKLNNWIKSVLIHLYAKRGDAVLDLGCGKGGDLIKWDKASISYYVGVDVAEGSIEDARNRYNGDTDHAQNRKAFSFPARLVCADCFEVPLDEALKDLPSFDICSCQFALHYSWSTEERARQTLHNVTTMLLPGVWYIQKLEFGELMRKLGALGDGTEGNNISDDEWEAAYIYLVFVFRKKGTPKIRQRAVPKGSFKRIEPEDVLFVQ